MVPTAKNAAAGPEAGKAPNPPPLVGAALVVGSAGRAHVLRGNGAVVMLPHVLRGGWAVVAFAHVLRGEGVAATARLADPPCCRLRRVWSACASFSCNDAVTVCK